MKWKMLEGLNEEDAPAELQEVVYRMDTLKVSPVRIMQQIEFLIRILQTLACCKLLKVELSRCRLK